MMAYLHFFNSKGVMVREALIDKLPENHALERNKDVLKNIGDEEVCVVALECEREPIFPVIISNNEAIYSISDVEGEDSILVASINEKDYSNVKKYALSHQQPEKDWEVSGEIHHFFNDGRNVLIICPEDTNTFINRHFDESKDDIIFAAHVRPIVSLSIVESIGLVASSSEDRSVRIWDIDSGNSLQTIQLRRCFPNVTLLETRIVIGWEGQPALWGWSFDDHRYVFTMDGISPTIVEFDIKCKYMLVGDEDGSVTCYTLPDGKTRWSTKLHDGWVYAITLCEELSVVVTSGSDGKLCVIDSYSGRLKKILFGHKHGVWNILKVGKGILISSGFDETIRVWDIRSGRCLAILFGHIHRIEEMIINHSQEYLVSRDRAGRVISWKSNWKRLEKS